jgi:hypothetical protein
MMVPTFQPNDGSSEHSLPEGEELEFIKKIAQTNSYHLTGLKNNHNYWQEFSAFSHVSRCISISTAIAPKANFVRHS